VGAVARVVVGAEELARGGLGVLQVAEEHRRPVPADAQPAHATVGQDAAVVVEDGGLDALDRLAHRAGADGQPGAVGDEDAAGLRLEPGVVDVAAERPATPGDDLGVQGLAHAREVTKAREAQAREDLRRLAHEHAQRRGGRVPDVDLLFLEGAHPGGSVVVAAELNLRHAERPRREHSVARAGDPARIRGAPVDVVRPQVEHVARGLTDEGKRAVSVHDALRLARRAGGVVQDRGRGAGGPPGQVGGAALAHQAREAEHEVGFVVGEVEHDRVAQGGQAWAQVFELAELPPGGEEAARARVAQAVGQRLFAEAREQHARHHPRLERPEEREAHGGLARGAQKQALARLVPERAEHVREARALGRELGVGDALALAAPGNPAEGHLAAEATRALGVAAGRAEVRDFGFGVRGGEVRHEYAERTRGIRHGRCLRAKTTGSRRTAALSIAGSRVAPSAPFAPLAGPVGCRTDRASSHFVGIPRWPGRPALPAC